jgi:hypothetical protein
MWVFNSPYAHVSVRLPIKTKRSFVAENQFFSETLFLQVLHHVGTELQRAALVVNVRSCSNCSLYGLARRRFQRICHSVGCQMSSSRLPLLVDLRGLRGNASLTRSTLTFEGPGRPVHFAIHRHPSRWNFSYHCFMLFLAGGSFPNFVRKRRCTVTIDCFRAYSSTQSVFSARVAIFTQPASLEATDVTKHPRQVQTNLESFSFYRILTILSPFKCTDFL